MSRDQTRAQEDQRLQDQVEREAAKAVDQAMNPILLMEAAQALQALAKGHWDRLAARDAEDQLAQQEEGR